MRMQENFLRTLERILFFFLAPGLTDHWPCDYECKVCCSHAICYNCCLVLCIWWPSPVLNAVEQRYPAREHPKLSICLGACLLQLRNVALNLKPAEEGVKNTRAPGNAARRRPKIVLASTAMRRAK